MHLMRSVNVSSSDIYRLAGGILEYIIFECFAIGSAGDNCSKMIDRVIFYECGFGDIDYFHRCELYHFYLTRLRIFWERDFSSSLVILGFF